MMVAKAGTEPRAAETPGSALYGMYLLALGVCLAGNLFMRIGADIWIYCANRGLIAECSAWLERAFEVVDEATQAAFPEARYGAGCLANFAGDAASARAQPAARHRSRCRPPAGRAGPSP